MDLNSLTPSEVRNLHGNLQKLLELARAYEQFNIQDVTSTTMSASSSSEHSVESNSQTRIEDLQPRQPDAHVISHPFEVNIQTSVRNANKSRSSHEASSTSVDSEESKSPTNKTSRKRKLAAPSSGEKKKCLRGEKKQCLRPGTQSSIGNVFSTIPIQCRNSDTDMLVILDRIRGELREILMEELARRKSFKFYLTISPLLHRLNVDAEVQLATPFLHSRPAIVMHTTDLDAEIDTAATRLTQLLECFEDHRSGYTLSEIEQCHVNVCTFDVIGGSSFIELPAYVKSKHACINVRNSDSKCLLYSLSYVRKPPKNKNANQAFHYKKDLINFNTTGLTFPTPVKQIPRFESQNPDFSVNVYGWLGKYKKDRHNKVRLYPMYTSPHRNRKHHANLLLLKHETHAHYVVIKSLSRLLHGRTAHDGKMHVCRYCLYSFTKKEACTAHEEVCCDIPAQVVSYPNEHNKYLQFKHIANGLRTPFTIYCDFESLLVPAQDETGRKIAKHIPASVGCFTVADCQEYNKEHIWTHSGPHTMEKFFEHLDKESARINAIMNDPKTMAPLAVEEKERYQSTKKLW